VSWIGKVGGGFLGFLAGGPVGAVIGTALGHQFDRGAMEAGHDPGRVWIFGLTDGLSRRRLVFETTFAVMGYLGRLDGRESEGGVRAARHIMQQMHLSAADTRAAIDSFDRGRRQGTTLFDDVAAMGRACEEEPELLRGFLQVQHEFLRTLSQASAAQGAALLRVAAAAGADAAMLAELEADISGSGPGRHSAGRKSRPSVAGALAVLGLQADASDAQVKQAYRRLMNRFHPDKQHARGLPVDARAEAEHQTREVRAAYVTIRDARGMR
jgi:DnaJ like chaperone protein